MKNEHKRKAIEAAEKIHKLIFGDDEKQVAQDKNAAIDEKGKTVQVDPVERNSTSDETPSINHRKIVEGLINGIEDFKYDIMRLENVIDMLRSDICDKDEEIMTLRNRLKKAEGYTKGPDPTFKMALRGMEKEGSMSKGFPTTDTDMVFDDSTNQNSDVQIKSENHTKDTYTMSYETKDRICLQCREYLFIGKDPQGRKVMFCPNCEK